ncbi:MAG: aspartyl protease [Dehalococcoidia bacterium]
MASVLTQPPVAGAEMGQVFISFAVVNDDDLVARSHGANRTTVRSALLDDVLMDTGASHLCLPASVIADLGLPLDREVPVETPTGIVTLRVFKHARAEFQGRGAVVEVLELAAGARPLFGALAMEALGVEPDTRDRVVRVLPAGEGGRSFIRA